MRKLINGQYVPVDPKEVKVKQALNMLRPEDDAHWNKDGKPNLNVLKEYAGTPVSKKDLEAYAPGFIRRSIAKVAQVIRK